METLVVGLSDAVQNFSALPSVKEELKDIKKIMNANKMYMNQTFTIPNVQNEFKHNDYAIVHFATHGVFGGTGKHSFLLTYDNQLDMDALEDLMSLGKYRDHQVDMLTLSACQTALGNERAALGLGGVAVKAGVRSAVATLWYVDDEATSLAIRELYRQLKKREMTKAKALQNAQKMLISTRQYWHPIYWAPFLLIGCWI
jgi:CHAT domain-containing protein